MKNCPRSATCVGFFSMWQPIVLSGSRSSLDSRVIPSKQLLSPSMSTANGDRSSLKSQKSLITQLKTSPRIPTCTHTGNTFHRVLRPTVLQTVHRQPRLIHQLFLVRPLNYLNEWLKRCNKHNQTISTQWEVEQSLSAGGPFRVSKSLKVTDSLSLLARAYTIVQIAVVYSNFLYYL